MKWKELTWQITLKMRATVPLSNTLPNGTKQQQKAKPKPHNKFCLVFSFL